MAGGQLFPIHEKGHNERISLQLSEKQEELRISIAYKGVEQHASKYQPK